jgi:hypothetical protein
MELIALAGFVAMLALVAGTLGVVFLVVKFVLWTVLLPIRLIFKLLWLPFFLVKGLLLGIVGLLAAPVLAIGALLAIVAMVVVVLLPLLPLLFVALAIWALVRLFSRPPTALPAQRST